MNRKNKLLISVLIFISIVAVTTVVIMDGKSKTYKKGVSPETDKAVAQARFIYEQKKKQNLDLSNGPCLSNDLMANWVLDLVHRPRQEVDNKPENQCQAYLEGRAQHFVELDLAGNLVRVR